MQHFIDSAGPFQLPTSWAEVTTRQFCEADPLMTVEQRASYFAGRPIQVNGMVADALAWMLSAPEAVVNNPLDLAQQSYEQVELIRAVLNSHPLSVCLPIVWGLFMAQHAQLNPASSCQKRADGLASSAMDNCILYYYGDVAHCLGEVRRIMDPDNSLYKELFEPDPTEAAQRARDAGAEELLGSFGYKNVLKSVALQLMIDQEDVKKMTWDAVAEHLIQERRQAMLSDNIQRNAKSSHE